MDDLMYFYDNQCQGAAGMEVKEEGSVGKVAPEGLDNLIGANVQLPQSGLEKKEENKVVDVAPAMVDNLIIANAQLSHTMAGLCQKIDQMGQKQNMVWSRPVPTLEKFCGTLRRASELDEWVRDATEKIRQVVLQGVEGVTYLCGFLEGPALLRVRNSKVETVPGLFECLQTAFGQELSYVDLEKQLHARVQQPHEKVWEFADSLCVVVEKLFKVRNKGEEERRWLLNTWFCRNIRNRKIGIKMQKVVGETGPGEVGRPGPTGR